MSVSVAGRSPRWGLLLALLIPYVMAALIAILTPLAVAGTGNDTFFYLIASLSLVASTVGAVILWRRPGNRVGATLMTGAIVLVSAAATWPISFLIGPVHGGALGLFQLAAMWWGSNGVLLGVAVLFPGVAILFPDGRLPGPRFRVPLALVIGLMVAGIVCTTLAPSRDQYSPWPGLAGVPYELGDVGGSLSIVGVLIAFVLAIVAVAVRFRRSRGVERAQMKWLIASVSLMAIVFPISWIKLIGDSDLIDNASVMAGFLVPIAIGIAVLRYRLYEIDRIVSRTISWLAVTTIVGSVFVLAVVGLQAVLSRFTEGNTLAVAGSTLVAATLFQPIRIRVQRSVDRRFHRARYDGERTVQALGSRLRDEVDLARIRSDVVATADEAVQPVAAAMWLRGAAE